MWVTLGRTCPWARWLSSWGKELASGDCLLTWHNTSFLEGGWIVPICAQPIPLLLLCKEASECIWECITLCDQNAMGCHGKLWDFYIHLRGTQSSSNFIGSGYLVGLRWWDWFLMKLMISYHLAWPGISSLHLAANAVSQWLSPLQSCSD